MFDNEFRIVASEASQAGHQVVINYGARSNDALLQQYGFWEAHNPDDRYVLADCAASLHAAGALPGGVELAQLRRLVAGDGALRDALAEVRRLRCLTWCCIPPG